MHGIEIEVVNSPPKKFVANLKLVICNLFEVPIGSTCEVLFYTVINKLLELVVIAFSCFDFFPVLGIKCNATVPHSFDRYCNVVFNCLFLCVLLRFFVLRFLCKMFKIVLSLVVHRSLYLYKYR
jgi:hypothetical protein